MRAFLILLLLASAANADTLFNFTMVDQFDVEHSDTEFAGRVAVLLWADRTGSDHAQRWQRTLEHRLESQLADDSVIMGMAAHVEGVPDFVKGRVLDSFPDDPEQWVLVDWQGEFRAAYDLEDDHCNLLVFGPDGTLLYRAAATGLDQTILDGVLAAVDEGLAVRTGDLGPPGQPSPVQFTPRLGP